MSLAWEWAWRVEDWPLGGKEEAIVMGENKGVGYEADQGGVLCTHKYPAPLMSCLILNTDATIPPVKYILYK
jgi:hypothetical protein